LAPAEIFRIEPSGEREGARIETPKAPSGVGNGERPAIPSPAD